jgi:hypothetical protein
MGVMVVTVPALRVRYPTIMLCIGAAARLGAAIILSTLGACRTAPRETCFSERGAEVWGEARYPATAPSAGTPAALTSLRVAPTTSAPVAPGGVIGGRQPIVSLIGPAGADHPDTIAAGAMNTDGRVFLPVAARSLRPGIYHVRVRDIGWVDAARDISLRPGERLDLEVQSRQAATCLGPVIQTSLAQPSRPAA